MRTPPLTITPAEAADWPDIWTVLEPIIRAGETYPYPVDCTEQMAKGYWIEATRAAYVARFGREIAGTCYLKPNQPGLGGHVANAGYAVARGMQGRGVGAALCRHSEAEARRMGFAAMQFNLVVASNERALALWKRLGYAPMARLPGAFDHARLGRVDAWIMYKKLDDPPRA